MSFSQDNLNKSNNNNNNLKVKKSNSVENILEDSGYPKSVNEDRKKRNKYDHVQSKVKQYIEEIKQQQKESEERRRRLEKNNYWDAEKVTFTTDTSQGPPVDVDVLKQDNAILKEENRNLIVQNAEKDIRIESMRREIDNLQRQINYLSPKEESTPIAKRNFYQTIFRPPIRNFSQSLLSPFKSTQSRGKLASDSSAKDLINRQNTINNSAQSESELNSDIFLEDSNSNYGTQKSHSRQTKPFWQQLICCSNNKKDSKIDTLRLQTINKVYPEIDRSECVNIEIPEIFVSHPQ